MTLTQQKYVICATVAVIISVILIYTTHLFCSPSDTVHITDGDPFQFTIDVGDSGKNGSQIEIKMTNVSRHSFIIPRQLVENSIQKSINIKAIGQTVRKFPATGYFNQRSVKDYCLINPNSTFTVKLQVDVQMSKSEQNRGSRVVLQMVGGYMYHFGILECTTVHVSCEYEFRKDMYADILDVDIDGKPIVINLEKHFNARPYVGRVSCNNVIDLLRFTRSAQQSITPESRAPQKLPDSQPPAPTARSVKILVDARRRLVGARIPKIFEVPAVVERCVSRRRFGSEWPHLAVRAWILCERLVIYEDWIQAARRRADFSKPPSVASMTRSPVLPACGQGVMVLPPSPWCGRRLL